MQDKEEKGGRELGIAIGVGRREVERWARCLLVQYLLGAVFRAEALQMLQSRKIGELPEPTVGRYETFSQRAQLGAEPRDGLVALTFLRGDDWRGCWSNAHEAHPSSGGTTIGGRVRH